MPKSKDTTNNLIRVYSINPDRYPNEMVNRVGELYSKGLTQPEIATILSTDYKTIMFLMRAHGIKARKKGPRVHYSGEKSSGWKGNAATYDALHARVNKLRGRPSLCEVCSTTTAKRYDWANLTGHYEDPSDYKRMCRSCHLRYDKAYLNFTQQKQGSIRRRWDVGRGRKSKTA